MGNVIIIAVIALIIILAVRSSMKHMKGEGGCCGGGESTSFNEEEKKLDGPVIGIKTLKIEGMHCDNCKNRIERGINRIDGASCRVDFKKKTAEVSYDRELDDDQLRSTVKFLDFSVTEITDRKL